MRLAAIVLAALLLAAVSGTVVRSAEEWEGPCQEAYAAWAGSMAELRQEMDALRKKKEEPLNNEILDAVSRPHRKQSTARIVESFLEKQKRQIAEDMDRCRERADRERFAFDDFKRCMASGARRRGSNEAQTLAAFSRDRDKVIAELRDLMTEEAYVQYKRERGSAPATSQPESWPRQRAYSEWQSPGDQRTNYGAPNQFSPRGYYGR